MSLLHHNLPPEVVDVLHTRHALLIDRAQELLAASERVPAIDDDDTAGKVGDFIKQLGALIKAAESQRETEKEPYLSGGRAVDGFFARITSPVTKAKRIIEDRLAHYLRAKAEQERRRREEAARVAWLEAEEKRRQAELAEQALRDERTLQEAIERTRQAAEADAAADKARAAAEAKPAELGRTRGEYGAVATLKTLWTFRDMDRHQLDLEALRPHLARDALERAIRSYIKAGGRELRGVDIYETTSPLVV